MRTPTTMFSILALAAALMVPGSMQAQRQEARAEPRIELLKPAAGDLVPSRLAAGPFSEAPSGIERAPLTYSWSVAADSRPTAVPTTFQAESREYWFQIEGRELLDGVTFSATAPGALVRINPLPGAKAAAAAIDPRELRLIDPRGEAHAAGSGMEQLATADQLREAGAPFVEGTAAFRVGAELGAGNFTLRAEKLVDLGARYVVHVFDRGSDAVLRLKTDRNGYFEGDRLTIETSLTTRHGAMDLDEITAFVTSPAGRSWRVTLWSVGSVYRGPLRLESPEETDVLRRGVLWQVQVSAHGVDHGRTVIRSVRTAFAAAAATARLVTASAHGEDKSGLSLRFVIEAAVAGRYEVRGVLYATGRDGELHPVRVAQSAAWVEAGQGELLLDFSSEAVRRTGLGAPYEVRDLRLMDQGRMGLLHRQARGVVIRN